MFEFAIYALVVDQLVSLGTLRADNRKVAMVKAQRRYSRVNLVVRSL